MRTRTLVLSIIFGCVGLFVVAIAQYKMVVASLATPKLSTAC